MHRKKADIGIIIKDTIPTLAGHIFVGWNNIYEEKVYKAGDTFTLNINLTLYAMWEHACEECNGTGIHSYVWECDFCDGKGTRKKCGSCGGFSIQQVIGQGYSYYKCNSCGSTSISTVTCTWCSGKGKENKTENCSKCNGLKYIKEDAPIVLSIKARSVILKEKSGYEYSMDGNNFQNSPVFENLHPNTQYVFYQRLAKTKNGCYGCTSKGVTISTISDDYYYINYVLNDGTNNDNNPTKFYANSTVYLYEPVREHYDFYGWNYNGKIIDKITSNFNTDIVLEAIWTPHKYLMELDLNGGAFESEEKISINYIIGNTTKVIKYNVGEQVTDWIPEYNGVFLGWYLDQNYGKKYNFDFPLTNNMYLYAKFYKFASDDPYQKADKYTSI